MARKPKCWKWSTGPHGATVTVFERVPGGSLYIGVPRTGVGYQRVSLGHTDRAAAMREATDLAARRQAGEGQSGPLTVATLFALYLKSVEGKQSRVHRVDTLRGRDVDPVSGP